MAQRDGKTGVGPDVDDGRLVGFVLIDGDFLGHVVQPDRPFEKRSGRSMIALSAQQKIDGGTGLVYCPVQVLPFACDLDVGLVDAPAFTHRSLASTTHRDQHGQHLDGPSMYGCVIDFDATFGHHLLKLSQAQRIGHVPANARQDDFSRMMHPQEHATQSFVQRFFDQFASAKPIMSTLLRQYLPTHIIIPIHPTHQPNRIILQVPPRVRLIVPEVVIKHPRLLILNLLRKPEVVHRRCRLHGRLALPIHQIRDDAVNGGGPSDEPKGEIWNRLAGTERCAGGAEGRAALNTKAKA